MPYIFPCNISINTGMYDWIFMHFIQLIYLQSCCIAIKHHFSFSIAVLGTNSMHNKPPELSAGPWALGPPVSTASTQTKQTFD